jgi:ParB family transcriptional regulator, chromosome partitioning protein
MAKMNQKRELGKGIRALLGDINTEINEETEVLIKEKPMVANINFVSLDKIEVNPFQPRVNFDEEALNELASSISIHGIIQPLTVREIPGSQKYQLISGERRWRASHIAQLKEVPVYIRSANDQEALEMALIENIQREELNAIEIGVNYQRLIDECQLNHEELADRVGKKRATISNYIRLLKLPPDIQVAVREDKISMGHARALAGVEEIDIQLSIFKEVLDRNLSVRQTEAIVAQRGNASQKPRSPKGKIGVPPVIKRWQDDLSSLLSTKVNIQHNPTGNGQITLSYADEKDLERIIELIS